MHARTCVEVVRNLCRSELLVQSAVHLVEEILSTAIDDELHRIGLELIDKVNYGVVVPILGILLDCTQAQ